MNNLDLGLISHFYIDPRFLFPGICGDIWREENGILEIEMSQTETTSNQQCLFRVIGSMGKLNVFWSQGWGWESTLPLGDLGLERASQPALLLQTFLTQPHA